MATERPSTERAVLLLATLVALSGVVGSIWVVTSASTTGPSNLDGDAADRYESIGGVEGTRITTIERNGTVTSDRTYSVQLRPGTGEKRLSLVEGSESRYDQRVSNGSVLWLYDRSENSVTRIWLGGADSESTRGDRIGRLVARLNATTDEGSSDEPPTVEPLPVVPRAPAGQSDAHAGSALGVSYAGTETVADREVHVVRLTPVTDDGTAEYEQTLWIDAEHYFPLKQRTAWTQDGERTVLTTTYADVEFDPGLADSAFTPDFPADTAVRSPDTPETTTYRDVGALRESTNVSVPDPDVPPSYELAYATRTEGRVQGVGLRYVNSTSVLTISKYDFAYSAGEGDEEVTIDGRTARLTRGHRVTLSWRCETYRYTVRGTGVSGDAVVEVGKSVGCSDPGAEG